MHQKKPAFFIKRLGHLSEDRIDYLRLMVFNFKTRLFLFVILSSLLFPVISMGSEGFDDTFSESNDGGKPSGPELHFQTPAGKLNQNFLVYPIPIENFDSTQERLDLEVETGLNYGSFNARLVPWAYLRTPDSIGALPKNKTRVYFEAKEAWIDFTSPLIDVRAGNQIISWGAADQINPTDQWNAREMSDPLLSQKLPQTTARAYFHPPEYSNLVFEFLYSPFFRQSILPLNLPTDNPQIFQKNESRWFLPLPTRVKTEGFSAPLRFRIETPTYPETWQAGTRMQILRVSGWDFSFSYFNGVEKIPRTTFAKKGDSNNPDLPVTLTVYPSYHRMQMFGFDGAGSLDILNTTFGIRFETAYNYRDNTRAKTVSDEFRDDLMKDDYVQSVLGLDHTFENKFLGTILYMNAMAIYTKPIIKIERPPGLGTVQGLPNTDPFDKNFILYIEDRVTSTFKLSNILVMSAVNLDGILSPAINYQLTDNLKSSLGADFYFSIPSQYKGFYKQYEDNKRLNLNFSYAF